MRQPVLQEKLLKLLFPVHCYQCLPLDLVRTEGSWEAWVDFFLERVELIASNAVETAKRL